MIPKRAFFYWSGKSMSWLRQQSIETFRKFNKGWKVNVIFEQPKNGIRPVHRSDIFRYHELATLGGVYFDTDIVFFKPFPSELLDAHALISIDPRLRFSNIGVLGSSGNNPMFSEIHQAAVERYAEQVKYKPWEGQLVGVHLLNRMFHKEAGTPMPPGYPGNELCEPSDVARALSERYGIKVRPFPWKFITPIDSFHIHKLFNATPFAPPEESIGVHWYGGDVPNSKPFEQKINEDNWRKHKCYLTSALERAYEA